MLDEWLYIACVDLFPFSDYVVCGNEILSGKILASVVTFGSGIAAFEKEAAANKSGLERYAFHCGDRLVALDVVYDVFPCHLTVKMLEFRLDFHDNRKKNL